MSDKNTGNLNIIKKYANRRLYDTGSSTYVTLEGLCKMVKSGLEFKVVDAKSGDDITRSVLTQIIFEQESKGYNLLPINFLRHIISFYDDSLSAFVPTYLERMMEEFSNNQNEMRNMMNNNNSFSPFPSLEQISKQNLEIFEQTMNMFNPFAIHKDKYDK